MKQYLELMRQILDYGQWQEPSRDNMPRTKEIFGAAMKFDLSEGFPLLTTKKMAVKSMLAELIWFLRGSTNNLELNELGCHVWNQDCYRRYQKKHPDDAVSFEEFDKTARTGELPATLTVNDFDCGHIYGHLWRNWDRGRIKEESGTQLISDCVRCEGIDQIEHLIHLMLVNPSSRYQIVSAWNPFEYAEGDIALPSCHCFWQTNVSNGKINLNLYQRSCDLPLGVPFNIASYAALVHILCDITGYKPGVLTWFGGSVHIYENQIDQCRIQITRYPRELPLLKINWPNEIIEFIRKCRFTGRFDSDDINAIFNHMHPSWFEIDRYHPWPAIKYQLSTGLK